MGKILYMYDKLPTDLTSGIKISNSGYNAECFLITDPSSEYYRKVFKKFINPTELAHDIEQNYKKLLDIDSDVFVFPEELVYLNDILVGYIMRYVNGTELKKTSRDEYIRDYYNAIKEVEQSILYDATHNGVKTDDINPTNIIYTPEKKMKIVDTDFYDIDDIYIRDAEDIIRLGKENYREYNLCMLSYLFNGALFDCPEDFTKVYNDFMMCMKGNYPLSDLLMEAKIELERYLQTRCDKLSDLDKGFKLIKKRDRM